MASPILKFLKTLSLVQDLLPHMNEWSLPNSVLIINNVSIHKVASIWEMVEEHGARLLYLPSYSPDFNPIKLAFSSIKAWLRTSWDQLTDNLAVGGSVDDVLWQAVYLTSTVLRSVGRSVRRGR
jgi:hypothetical protein